MKPTRRLTALLALCLLVQMAVASRARGEEPSLGANVSAGVISALATVIMLPVKLVTCAATVALGTTAYGLTMGTSEIIREELVAGTNQRPAAGDTMSRHSRSSSLRENQNCGGRRQLSTSPRRHQSMG